RRAAIELLAVFLSKPDDHSPGVPNAVLSVNLNTMIGKTIVAFLHESLDNESVSKLLAQIEHRISLGQLPHVNEDCLVCYVKNWSTSPEEKMDPPFPISASNDLPQKFEEPRCKSNFSSALCTVSKQNCCICGFCHFIFVSNELVYRLFELLASCRHNTTHDNDSDPPLVSMITKTLDHSFTYSRVIRHGDCRQVSSQFYISFIHQLK
ncbi:hypothetical protein AHF37_12278, partial [Paragonimus kellicotti]